MQLLIEPNTEENLELISGVNNATNPNVSLSEIDYATQIRLMQSTIIIQRAVAFLQNRYPDISAEEIRSGLAVTRVLETDDEIETKILQVDYTGKDPQQTQQVLEVLKDVYLNYNTESQQLRLRNGLAFIDEQLPSVREDVARAERTLRQFRENEIVVDPEQQATDLTQELNAIASQRQGVQADLQDARSQLDTLRQQMARSPQSALIASRISASGRFQTLLNTLQETELEIAQQRAVLKDDAPPLQDLLTSLEEQRALIREEAARVIGGAVQDFESDELLTMAQLSQTDVNLIEQFVGTQTVISGLQARDQSLAQSEARLRAQLNQFPELIAEYNRLQPDITTKRDTLQQLLTARQELGIEIAQGGYTWQITESPDLGQKVGPNVKNDILLGVIAGLFLGSIAAFIRDSTDDVVHSVEELNQTVHLPLLGTLPQISPRVGHVRALPGNEGSPAIKAVCWSPVKDALDLIYQNINQSGLAPRHRSIAITSTFGRDDQPLIALGLAYSAARLHQRVLLIDADLRSPSLHHQLQLPNLEGLSTLIQEEQDSPPLHSIEPNIDVLTTGRLDQDPISILSSQHMRTWMTRFNRDYELVILNASTIDGSVDSIQAASLCDGTVLITQINQDSQAELDQAIAVLGSAKILGIIASGVKQFKSRVSVPELQPALNSVR